VTGAVMVLDREGRRTWRLHVLDPGVGYMNANQRPHWTRRHAMTAAWREAGAWHAKAARLPMLARAHIRADVRFHDARRRDPGNYHPTLKAIVDGIVTTARMLLPDDDARHLDGPDLRIGVPLPRGQQLRVDLLITELPPLTEVP
jgi:hypothetical protein